MGSLGSLWLKSWLKLKKWESLVSAFHWSHLFASYFLFHFYSLSASKFTQTFMGKKFWQRGERESKQRHKFRTIKINGGKMCIKRKKERKTSWLRWYWTDIFDEGTANLVRLEFFDKQVNFKPIEIFQSHLAHLPSEKRCQETTPNKFIQFKGERKGNGGTWMHCLDSCIHFQC